MVLRLCLALTIYLACLMLRIKATSVFSSRLLLPVSRLCDLQGRRKPYLEVNLSPTSSINRIPLALEERIAVNVDSITRSIDREFDHVITNSQLRHYIAVVGCAGWLVVLW